MYNYITMDKNMQMYLVIMLFYILLSYIVMPALFYYLNDKTLQTAGRGFIFGSVLSILLWHFYGRRMIK
jgi:hypothetical protein